MPCFLQTLCTFALANGTRGVAQLVSAPRSGRGGRKFESSHPDKKSDNLKLSLFLYPIISLLFPTPFIAPGYTHNCTYAQDCRKCKYGYLCPLPRQCGGNAKEG